MAPGENITQYLFIDNIKDVFIQYFYSLPLITKIENINILVKKFETLNLMHSEIFI
jgi:hypothetical protein